MKSASRLKMPSMALATAAGLSLFVAPIGAQELPEDPSQQQCRAELVPAHVSIPGQTGEEEGRQQRTAANVTVQARITPEMWQVEDVEIQDESGIEVSLKEEGAQTEEEEYPSEPRQEPGMVSLDLDLSEAKEGEWTVTFMGPEDQECTGTLTVRPSMEAGR